VFRLPTRNGGAWRGTLESASGTGSETRIGVKEHTPSTTLLSSWWATSLRDVNCQRPNSPLQEGGQVVLQLPGHDGRPRMGLIKNRVHTQGMSGR